MTIKKTNFISSFIILSLTIFLSFNNSNAQLMAVPNNLDANIAPDPNIKIGTLKNGIKYYIKKNVKPEKRMELRLAVNAGAVNEDDDQKGLAHFCEHMCFNGTKHFPKNDLVNFLEKTGVRFGADLNAYTAFEETVYMLQLPTDTLKLLSQGMDVLSDWAHEVSFDNSEIDKERGVVREELRLRDNGMMRSFLKHSKVTWNDSKFAYRFPGGDTNIILKAPYDASKRFYSDWYRPDLMAVIAVGDFDVDEIEKMIKEHFEVIPVKSNPRPKEKVEIPVRKGMAVSIHTEKEIPVSFLGISYLGNVETEGTYGSYKKSLMRQMTEGMLNARFMELTQKANPPYVQCGSNIGRNQVGNRQEFGVQAIIKEDDFNYSFTGVVSEIFRASKNGFTESELARQRTQIISEYEKNYNERDKTQSASLAGEFVRNYLRNEPIPGIEKELGIVRNMLPEIKVEDINSYFKSLVKDDDLTFAISLPEKDNVKIPKEEEVKALYNKIKNENLVAYKDEATDKPLFSRQVTPGTVKTTSENKDLNIKTWVLSNGAKVIFKPTNFKSDEILFQAFSLGGHSLVSDNDFISAAESDKIIEEGGLSEFNSNTLTKLIQGKQISCSPFIGELYEGFRGSATPKDFETFFQVLNLSFTEPRKDKESFEAFKSKQKDFLKTFKTTPEQAFNDTVEYVLGNYHQRRKPLNEEFYDKINLDKAFEIYKQRFADASDFTFVFVGNIEENSFKELVCKYIGSLPSTNSHEKYKDLHIEAPKGKLTKIVKKGLEAKSQVHLIMDGNFDYNPQNRYEMSSLIAVLNIRLREELREEKGGVYGVQVFPSLAKMPKGHYSVNVMFTCQPNRVDELITAVKSIIEELKTKQISDDNLLKVKQTQKRGFETNSKDNGFWLQNMYSYALNNEDVNEVTKYPSRIEKLNKEEIKKLANQYLNSSAWKEFIRNPEK